ncbi:hypothetical protein C0J52_15257 [Blattella germanica]|nr:hypothetical protein C0J52_15257 [Blattella germanica]
MEGGKRNEKKSDDELTSVHQVKGVSSLAINHTKEGTAAQEYKRESLSSDHHHSQLNISTITGVLCAIAVATHSFPLPGIEESFGHLSVAPIALSHGPAIEIPHAPIAIPHEPITFAHAPVAVAHAPIIKEVEHHAPANYEFKYGVHDSHTHDIKEQAERRHGDRVEGHYSLVEPDGTTRTVKYTADHHNGFNAVVTKTGHATHPATPVKVAVPVAAPVIAHAPIIAHEAPAITFSHGHELPLTYH